MADLRDKAEGLGRPLIIGAVVFGLVGAVLAYAYLKSEKAALVAEYAGLGGEQISVLVAGQDLPKGTVLSVESLSQRNIPSGFVSNDAILSRDFESYLGRVIEVDVGAGKPILTSYVDVGLGTDFSTTVTPGRRALTVQVNDINSIAGFLRPGNRIDLFVNIPTELSGFSTSFINADLIDTLPPDLLEAIPPDLLKVARNASVDDPQIQALVAGALPKEVIMPVLQGVRVLATGRDPYVEQLDSLHYPQPRNEASFSTITLDVSPREAVLLSAAQDKGDLLAILRNRDDESQADFSMLAAQDLFANAFKMRQAESERRARLGVAAGVDAQGNLVDADGKAIMSAEQLAKAGLTVNADGQLVDKDGNVVDPANLLVTADGRVLDKAQLAKAGLTVDANGQVVDKNGNVVDAADLVVAANGEVLNKRALADSGFTVNENGEIVDASGRVIDPSELVTTADGTIVTTQQLADAGLSVNENGEIVDANGNVVDPATLTTDATGALVAATAEVIRRARGIDLILGGSPTDGVAKTTTLNTAK